MGVGDGLVPVVDGRRVDTEEDGRPPDGRAGPLPPRAHPEGGKVMLMQLGATSETRPISVTHFSKFAPPE